MTKTSPTSGGSRWVDPIRVHDAIRFGTAAFRPVDPAPDPLEYSVSIDGSDLQFVGPTLFAVAETARLHHQRLHHISHRPIYTLRAGTYTWWDDTTTTTDAGIDIWLPSYLATVLGVDENRVSIRDSQEPSAPRTSR